MTDAVINLIGSLVVGMLSLIGVVFTVSSSNKKTENQIQKNQAVTDTKIEELTREVREHNNFAQQIPVINEKISVLSKNVDSLEKRVKELEDND